MIVGTAVKITTNVEIDGGGSPDSVSIEIYYPNGSEAVALTAMTDDGGNEYSYIYQSAVGDEDGKYKVIVTAVKGSYTARSKEYFTLNER